MLRKCLSWLSKRIWNLRLLLQYFGLRAIKPNNVFQAISSRRMCTTNRWNEAGEKTIIDNDQLTLRWGIFRWAFLSFKSDGSFGYLNCVNCFNALHSIVHLWSQTFNTIWNARNLKNHFASEKLLTLRQCKLSYDVVKKFRHYDISN